MATVLLVEDDDYVRQALLWELRALGHAVRSAGRALDALREVAAQSPEVVVLDLGLPDLDGGEVLKMMRAISDAPVIVATARDGEEEIIRLLSSGADDYVAKPFSAGHLHARIEAALRRARGVPQPEVIVVGGLRVDVDRWQASLEGKLLAEVWRQPYGDDQTIDVPPVVAAAQDGRESILATLSAHRAGRGRDADDTGVRRISTRRPRRAGMAIPCREHGRTVDAVGQLDAQPFLLTPGLGLEAAVGRRRDEARRGGGQFQHYTPGLHRNDQSRP